MCFSKLSFNLLTMFLLASEYPALLGISSLPPVRPPAQTQDLSEQPQRQHRLNPHPPLLSSKPNSTIPGYCADRALEGVIIEHNAIKREVRLLRQKTSDRRGQDAPCGREGPAEAGRAWDA